MPSLVTAVLTAHPTTPSDAVHGLEVRLHEDEPGILVFEYSLEADLSRIRVPESGAGGPADGLWKHTCFEAFVGSADAPGYHEFNFSPSLDWAVYRFRAYREGMSAAEMNPAPQITVRRNGGGLELRSAVCLRQLADVSDARHLRIALAAVIEADDGRLSYWGLRHPAGHPDFHHSNGFALEVGCS
jgi:hypothetical protein